jgi:hypothetical protein
MNLSKIFLCTSVKQIVYIYVTPRSEVFPHEAKLETPRTQHFYSFSPQRARNECIIVIHPFTLGLGFLISVYIRTY